MRAFLILIACTSSAAHAGMLEGPGRFCGYSPIIDLREGELVETLRGGIHGGSFRWRGAFGTLEVAGIGWASRPSGKIAVERNAKHYVRFAQRSERGRYVVALWNKQHGAAYFSSTKPLTRNQISAIDRVELFEEGQEPQGCKLRTVFSWD